MHPARWYVKLAWGVMVLGTTLVSLYALAYVVLGEQMYAGAMRESFLARPWGIYTHAFFALFALAIGPFQFRGLLDEHKPPRHRTLGKVYVVGALMTGLSGLYMAFYAYGGGIAQWGFGTMAVALLATTALAYLKIRTGDIRAHRAWMVRSFAVLLAAVTLRVWLPLLVIAYQGDFTPAYRWVAWISWVPNLIVAEWFIRRIRQHSDPDEMVDVALQPAQAITG